MKKSSKVLLVAGVIIAGAFAYWQINKKEIIGDKIKSVVTSKSDSLYYIKYDSSSIDEVNGNASFYNVVLQSDSIQSRIANADSSEKVMYDVRVGEVSIIGTDIPGLIAGTNVTARSIYIINPVINIIRLAEKGDQILTRDDSLAIYERILGKYKSIKAEEILIKNGTVYFSDRLASPHTILKEINLSLVNFRVDSTKDYMNIVSYFIKGLKASVGEASFQNGALNFSGILYDAAKQELNVKQFRQKNSKGQIVSQLNDLAISGLSTNAFINNQLLIADHLSTTGGLLTIYRKMSGGSEQIELDSSFFDQAELRRITTGNIKVLIYNRQKPDEEPMEFNNIKFSASSIPPVKSGNRLKNIISNSNWQLSGDGISYLSDDKIYRIEIGAFDIDKSAGRVSIRNLNMIPQLSEAAFAKKIKVQRDMFDIQVNDILAKNIDIKMLIADRVLKAESISFSPVLKIYDDRTLPADGINKVGKYPHQLLARMKQKINVRKILINNGSFTYRERGAISAQIGIVFFSGIKGSISNVKNLNNEGSMLASITSKFMGVSTFNTQWNMPLNATNGNFIVNGKLAGIDGTVLNGALEPLGMASVKKGKVNSFNLNIKGNDYSAHTTGTLLYNDLKVEILKKDNNENDLQRRKALSLIANIIIRNNNPSGGLTRSNETDFPRDINRSFFNLMWKSLFVVIKKTVTGNNNN